MVVDDFAGFQEVKTKSLLQKLENVGASQVRSRSAAPSVRAGKGKVARAVRGKLGDVARRTARYALGVGGGPIIS